MDTESKLWQICTFFSLVIKIGKRTSSKADWIDKPKEKKYSFALLKVEKFPPRVCGPSFGIHYFLTILFFNVLIWIAGKNYPNSMVNALKMPKPWREAKSIVYWLQRTLEIDYWFHCASHLWCLLTFHLLLDYPMTITFNFTKKDTTTKYRTLPIQSCIIVIIIFKNT